MNKREIGLNLGAYAYMVYFIFGIMYYATLSSTALLVNNLITSALCFFFWYLFRNDKISYESYSHILILITFTALGFINLYLGGLDSPMMYWFLAIALGSGFLLNTKWMLIWGINLAIFYFVCLYMKLNNFSFPIGMKLEGNTYLFFHMSSLIGVISLVLLFALTYIDSSNKYNKTINETNNRNSLLLKVLNHDLANPIMVLDMHTKRLNEKNLENVKEKLIKSNQTIINILNSVRTIDKFHVSKIELEEVDLWECVTDATSNMKDLFTKKNINFSYEIPEDTVVNIDKNIFSNQILKNILTNACKFSAPDSTISLVFKENKLTISDSGIGIPEDMINTLFDYDSKNSRPGTMQEKGTGFGLPIVKDCCERMNIEIAVDSNKNGTNFILNFS